LHKEKVFFVIGKSNIGLVSGVSEIKKDDRKVSMTINSYATF
tara:strand:- start:346 stop:471 length:126 start_codon:yes stop_codon:yes gene_type:complete